MAGYNITFHEHRHVRDSNGLDVKGLCVWCYRITFDPGAGNAADRNAFAGDWRLDVPHDVIPGNDPQLSAAGIDRASVPHYSGGGNRQGGNDVQVDFPNPTVQPPAGPPAPTTNITWVDLCFVVKCGDVGEIRIAVDRRRGEGRFEPVNLEEHDRLKKNEQKLNGPK